MCDKSVYYAIESTSDVITAINGSACNDLSISNYISSADPGDRWLVKCTLGVLTLCEAIDTHNVLTMKRPDQTTYDVHGNSFVGGRPHVIRPNVPR